MVNLPNDDDCGPVNLDEEKSDVINNVYIAPEVTIGAGETMNWEKAHGLCMQELRHVLGVLVVALDVNTKPKVTRKALHGLYCRVERFLS